LLRLKFLQIILCICIFLISLYIIDKITSENSNDAANIIIGISNIDSNSCLMCQPDGDFFNSGCKRCIQDNINFRAKTAMNQPFISSWSNDYAMLYGDENCSGEIILPALSVESNKQYWTEIHLNNSNYSISLFDNSLQGFEIKEKHAFGFQGHPEASPGPQDINLIFNKFISFMSERKNANK